MAVRQRSGGVSACVGWGAAAALVLGAGLPASAQPTARPARGRVIEAPANVSRVSPLHVTQNGAGTGPLEPGFADGCQRVNTHATFDFSGTNQQVIMQAGMIAGEMAAQTYTLTAADFPLKLNTAEILFVSQANVQTTTRWTVQVWSGTPTNGTMVASESSDGDLLPHAVITPPNNNALLVFQIDPADPDQIIIQDNGSHQFTIGFRIDQHNAGGANQCSTPPPTNSNAFFATDTDGAGSLTGNWLFAVPCPLSCPAGWWMFQQLQAGICRPSGDWIMRATWEPLNCSPATGACCLPGLSCQVLTQAQCLQQNGTFQGAATTCASCPSPTGACCFGSGGCINVSQADCTTAGGVYQGNNTACAAGNTCPTGACCLPNGTCISTTSAQCVSQGGAYQGANSQCGSVSCPQPTGACCVNNGGCLTLTQANCAVIPGVWQGPGSTCGSGVCSQPQCYANCDGSTQSPVLNVADFTCFLQRFAAGESYANCDQSTQVPVLNVADFTCYLQRFASGCP
jgi:hypothetical protein